MISPFILVLIGAVVGVYGTLIGAGGGFVLVPILLLLYPHDQPTTITTISLAVVCCNALSGSAAYARMKRIDYQTGRLFAVATVPGAIVGVFTTTLFKRGPFDLLLGVLLVLLAIWLAVRPSVSTHDIVAKEGWTRRRFTDAEGTTYSYAFSLPLGMALSVCVGFLSSLLGIGGGIIHVPAMVQLLNVPPHVATAASHFVLSFTSLVGSSVHAVRGDFHNAVDRTIALSIGVIAGAQGGARLSRVLHGSIIVRLLALALGAVGVRLIIGVIS